MSLIEIIIESSSVACIQGTVSFASMHAQISIKAARKLTNSTSLSSYSINAHLHVYSITNLQVTSHVAAARKRSHHWWLFPWPQTIPWILKQSEEWHVFVSWDQLWETLQAAPTLLSYRGYSWEVCKTAMYNVDLVVGWEGFNSLMDFVRQKLVFLHNNPYTIPFDSVACVFNIEKNCWLEIGGPHQLWRLNQPNAQFPHNAFCMTICQGLLRYSTVLLFFTRKRKMRLHWL